MNITFLNKVALKDNTNEVVNNIVYRLSAQIFGMRQMEIP